MIINKLEIDGFGIFKDHEVDGFGPGINVLYGRNESGKSTLLDFIRFTLFGYPRLHDKRRPPLNGGQHGGSITLKLRGDLEDAKLYRSGANDIKLSYKNEVFTQEKDWRALVSHAEADLYNNIYGITLDELTEKDNLTESQMKDKIFSMGLGLADVKLGEVQSGLVQQAEEIYLPRGRTKLLNELHAKIKALKKEIKLLENTRGTFDQVNSDLQAVEEERKALSSEVEKMRRKKQSAETLLAVFDHYVVWRTAAEELSKKADVKRIPSEVIEEYATSKKNLQLLNGDIVGFESSIKNLEGQLSDLPIDPVYEVNLSRESQIQQNLGLAKNARAELNRSKDQLSRHRARQKEISDSWGATIDRESILGLKGFRLLSSQAQEIHQKLDKLTNDQKRLEDRKSDLQPQKLELDELRVQMESELNALAISSDAECDLVRDKIRTLRTQREAQQIRGNTKGGSRNIFILILISGFLVSAIGFALGPVNSLSGLVVVLGVIIAILGLWKLVRSGGYGGSIEEWEQSHRKEQEWQHQVQAYEDYIKREEIISRDEQVLSRRINDLEQQLSESKKAQLQSEKEWANLISKQPLPRDWEPKTFLSAKDDLAEYLEKERQSEEEQSKVKRAEEQIGNLNALLEPFPARNEKDLISHAQDILTELEKTRENLQQKKEFKNKLEDLNKRLKAKQIIKDRTLEQLQAWDESYIQPDDSWAEHLEVQNEIEQLEETKNEAYKAIQYQTGPDAVERVLEQLEDKSKPQLADRREEVQSELQTLENKYAEILEKVGRLQQQIQELSQPDDLQKKLSQLESYKEQMREAQIEWLSYRLAADVLVQSQRRFEEEKQPHVIQNSEHYFQAITDNRYKSIQLSIMDSDIRLETQKGQKKKVEELSRGTREQLLLALRLGLIEEYEQKAEDLPVALDDVFVNFDAKRAEQTAKVLAAFAKNRQVIIFTCHSSTRDLFSNFRANILDWTPQSGNQSLPSHITHPQ